MGLFQFLVGPVAENIIKGDSSEQEGYHHDGVNLALAGRAGFGLHDFHILYVDGMQFAGIQLAVVDDGRIQHFHDLPCRAVDGVLLAQHLLGLVLFQEVALDVVQGIDVELVLEVFHHGAVPGHRFLPPLSHKEVIAGVGEAFLGVRKLGLLKILEGGFGLIVPFQSFQRKGQEQFAPGPLLV